MIRPGKLARVPHRLSLCLISCALLVGACSSSAKPSSSPTTTPTSGATGASTSPTTTAAAASIGHVFIIMLENKGFNETWSAKSPAQYLNATLRPKGKLLTKYFGIGHASLDNYIALISGQAPNPQTRADCVVYTEFQSGSGCVYPKSVLTLADQLSAAGKTWKTYQEDMTTPCRHPAIGAPDTTVAARKNDMYATRHNPFVYFHSIIDSPVCETNVVDLSALDADLADAKTTPNLVFITPNLCHDGHDAPCVDGEPGGLQSADAFLQTVAPKILQSPAFKQDGLLIITFDESEGADNGYCCGQPAPGGGLVGALLIGARVKPNTAVDTPYNHYSLLCSVEDIFGVSHLARAAAKDLPCFSTDVYDGS